MSQSYIPLYRKYRPQSFGDLVGQEVVVKALSNAIELDKISHAYLFCGSRGTGKTSAARILAKSLNCLEGPTATPCGTCANCISITNGSAIDVTEIDAASNNGVEDARDIIEKVQFVPVSGKFKIFIIDEVHMLSNSAFNTLLKTLEEPPENLVFILATTEPHKILDTIISRCQRFDFRKIKIADIVSRLKYIANEEQINISDEAIEMISQKSTGGLRDAIALLDQASVLGLGGNEITVDDILSISGAISQDNLYALTETLAKKDSENLIELIHTITNQGNEPILVLTELVSYFRNLLLVKNGGNSDKINDLLGMSEQFVPKLKEQSQFFETIEIAQIIEKMAEYEIMLKNTTNTMMWLEVILISILHRQDIKVIKDLEKRVSTLESAISGGNVNVQAPQMPIAPTKTVPSPTPKAEPQINQPVSKPAPVEKPAEPKTESSTEPQVRKPTQTLEQAQSGNSDLKQDWINLLSNIDSFPAKNFFMGLARPVAVSSTEIIIALKSESLVKGAKESKKVSALEEAAKKHYGKEPKVSLITFDEAGEVKKKSKIETPADTIKSHTEHTIATQAKPTAIAEKPIETIEKTSVEIPKPASESTAMPKPEAPAVEDIKELVQQKETPIQIEQNVDETLDNLKEITKEIETEKPLSAHDFSDDTKMFIDLFQGKIID